MEASPPPLAPFRLIAKRLTARRTVDVVLIAVGLVTIALHSVPGGTEARNIALQIVLFGCLSVFALEWFSAMRAAANARDYWVSLNWITDALAVLPVPVALLSGVPSKLAWLLGAFWLLKLVRISPGLARLKRVISLESGPLASVLLLFLTVLFVGAVALHLAERQAQPQIFGSLPDALWWAVATLTTTGYGDAVPVTALGRIVAGFVMICGVGVFGLLTGILATGFVEESRRYNFVETWRLVKSVPFFNTLDASSVIELSRLLRRWDVPEGTTVIRRGSIGDCMYFVASGEVQVAVEPQPVRLGGGSFFGELALIGDGVRGATVTTVMPTTLLILDLANFRVFSANHRELSDAIEAEGRKRRQGGAFTTTS